MQFLSLTNYDVCQGAKHPEYSCVTRSSSNFIERETSVEWFDIYGAHFMSLHMHF